MQFCRDQHGSRFIQQKLEVSSEDDKEAFFEEILPHTQRYDLTEVRRAILDSKGSILSVFMLPNMSAIMA